MRGAVVGSALVHLALIVLMLMLRPPLARIVPGPDAVQVALVDPSALTAPPAPAPTPAPQPEPRAVEPPPERDAVRIEKPKSKPERKKTEEPPPAPEPAKNSEPVKTPDRVSQPDLPYAAIGNAGLRGAVAVDGPPFEFAYYLQLIRNRVGQTWAPPAGLVSGSPIRAVIHFTVARDGGVQGVALETASGIEFFDRAALRAVQLADPMPPLPLGYGGSTLGVHFGFEYVSP